MSDAKERLAIAGISGAALSTTLHKLNQKGLRELIMEESLEYVYTDSEGEDSLGYRGVAMYCGDASYREVRLVAEVFAKELLLYGYTPVRVCSLTQIIDAVEYYDDYMLDGYRGHTIIRDFYVGDNEAPFTGRMLQRIQSMLLDLMDAGHAYTLVAASEKPPEGWDWYSHHFRSAIEDRCIAVAV